MNIKTKTTLGITVFGVLYTIATLMMEPAPVGNPHAPKVFPLILGVGVIVMGLFYYLRELKAWKAQVAKDGDKKVDLEKLEKAKKVDKLIALTCVSGIIYALAFERLGYVIATSLFIWSIMTTLNGKAKWKRNITTAVVFSVAVYILFVNLLAIPLPPMPILEI